MSHFSTVTAPPLLSFLVIAAPFVASTAAGAAELTRVSAPPGGGAPAQADVGPPVNAAPEKTPSWYSGKWSGYASLDTRLFFHSPKYPEQDDQNISVAIKPEYYSDWSNNNQRLAFSPFLRLDANDSERTHADIRELYWQGRRDRWLLKVGVDVVFWGVAESQHLVNIINQTDLVENLDGEEKLGQPMVNLDYRSNWGTWQFFYLPVFRERTFPGPDGRLRNDPAVDTDHPLYESSKEDRHSDFALRWSKYVGDWDIGLAHFSGTSRVPLLVSSTSSSEQTLVPFYAQIDQTSVDVQATKGAWLWKFEGIYNQNNLKDYHAYVGGFEFTNFGFNGGDADLGWLLEYHYDNTGDLANNQLTPAALQNDIYVGLRWSGNDMQTTSLLSGVIVDLDNQSTFFNLEFDRRLAESWTLGVEVRLFWNVDESDIFYPISDDDHVEIRLTRHF